MLLLYKGVKTRVGWNIEPTVCQQNLNMLKLEFIHFCTVNQFEQLQFEMYSSWLTLLGGFLVYALIVIFLNDIFDTDHWSRHFIFTIFGLKLWHVLYFEQRWPCLISEESIATHTHTHTHISPGLIPTPRQRVFWCTVVLMSWLGGGGGRGSWGGLVKNFTTKWGRKSRKLTPPQYHC